MNALYQAILHMQWMPDRDRDLVPVVENIDKAESQVMLTELCQDEEEVSC